MLGFLKRSMSGSIDGRRRSLESETPRGYVDLTRSLVRQGRGDRALDVARDGCRRFPRSLELADQLRLIWRQVGRERERELLQAVDASQAPESFLALVEHYIDGEELDSALAAADRFAAAFPDVASAAATRGRVLRRRFERDHVAADGLAALRALHRAVDRDASLLGAHQDLSEIYAYIGAPGRALHHVYALLDSRPDDVDGLHLKAWLSGLPLESATEEELIQQVEERDRPDDAWRPRDGRPPNSPPGFRARVARALQEISSMAGVSRAAFVHPEADLVAREGQVVQSRRSDGDAFLALAAALQRNVSLCSKRIGIGAFQEAEIASGSASVLAFGGWSSVLVVVIDSVGARDAVTAAARDFVAAVDRWKPEAADV